MALLDYFGYGDPSITDPEQKKYLQQQALMGMAQGLLNSSGWSATPVTTGQAMGQGLLGMQQGKAGAMETLMAREKLGMLREAQQAKAQGVMDQRNAANALAGTDPVLRNMGVIDPKGLANNVYAAKYGLPGDDIRMGNLQARWAEILANKNYRNQTLGQGEERNELREKELQAAEARRQLARERQIGVDTFGMETKLSDDYRADSKNFAEMKRAYSNITKSLESDTPAATLATATSFMKLLDPESVVRESELGMALNTQGSIDKMMNYGNLITEGRVLTTEQKKDFKSLVDQYWEASKDAQKNINNKYSARADRYKVDKSSIIMFDDVDQTGFSRTKDGAKGAVDRGGQVQRVEDPATGKKYIKIGEEFFEVNE